MTVPTVIARAPNHLGDGLMAQPAVRALASLDIDLRVQAPSWGELVYAGLRVVPPGPMPSVDVALLLAPSLRAAWHARRARRRIGLATDFRAPLLTDIVVPARHRSDTYARIVQTLGAVVAGEPTLQVSSDASTFPKGHVGLIPISRSGTTVQWSGYAELARRVRAPVIVYGAAEEREQVARAVPGWDLRGVGTSLAQMITALQSCRVVVANDSGGAHLARAAGVPVVVVYGSTAPDRTGAAGSVAVTGPAPSCQPCYRRGCARGDLVCLQIPVEHVLHAVSRVAPEVLGG